MMNRAHRRSGQQQGQRSGHQVPTVSVFVGHLHKEVTERELHILFKDCGEIHGTFIQTQPDHLFTYGFVRFLNLASAEQAVKQLDGWPVRGLNIRVEISDQSQSGESYPRQGLKATNEDYYNLGKLMFAMADVTRFTEESDNGDMLDAEKLLTEISETSMEPVKSVKHPAQCTLDLQHLDNLLGTCS